MKTLNCINPTAKAGSKRTGLRLFFLAQMLVAVGLLALPTHGLDVRGANGNSSLSAIAGTETLVTVVLKGGAEDPNLQVVEARSDVISFSNDKGNLTIYSRGDIDHIKIQGSVVERRKPVIVSSVALRPEDQRIVDQAISRAAELFQTSKDNQELRIRAAALMAFDGNKEAAQYLTSLVESNNLRTRLDAARGLYLAGMPAPDSLIREGLESNNRNIRAETAELAGLFEHQESTAVLMEMFNDRSAQYAAPAAVALARLGNREIIPGLFDMLGSNSNEKNQAGIEGLKILGGDDVIETAKYRIEKTDGLERYRHIKVLHALGDEEGRKQMIRVLNEELTIKPEAALILAADQYFEAAQYLQERLKRREDPTAENLSYRARNAAAIMQSGDPSAVYVFQELLRKDDVKIKIQVLHLIADLQDRTLLKLIQTSVSNIDAELSMAACDTAMAIANPTYAQRLKDLMVGP